MFLQGPMEAQAGPWGAQIWAQGVTFLVFGANLAPRGRFLDFSGLGERTLTFLVNTFLVSKVGVSFLLTVPAKYLQI